MLVCPACHADRLIPLTFPIYQRNGARPGQPELMVRPIAKCSGCGKRIFAHVLARQRTPKSGSQRGSL